MYMSIYIDRYSVNQCFFGRFVFVLFGDDRALLRHCVPDSMHSPSISASCSVKANPVVEIFVTMQDKNSMLRCDIKRTCLFSCHLLQPQCSFQEYTAKRIIRIKPLPF